MTEHPVLRSRSITKDMLVKAGYVSLFVEGHEQMHLVTHTFPVPLANNGSGTVVFYETIDMRTSKFLEAVKGQGLRARVVTVAGVTLCTAEGVRFEQAQATARFEDDKNPLHVATLMTWETVTLSEGTGQ